MTVIDDAALIERTRNGDMSAYDELYRRHVDHATKVARIVMSNDDEAQDLVSEAFMRVLRRLQDGGGPQDDLAPYLRTVVRRLAIDYYRSAQRSGSADPSTFDVMPRADDPIAKATDGELVRRAFEGLPARWQEVLWRTEIEGRSPAWLAERLGTSANSVAALAYRAREGLRQAYVSMNITVQDRPECKPFARKIPALVRGTLPVGETGPLRDHIQSCASCRERRDELHVLVSDLPAVLWPALLLPIAGPNIAAGAGTVTGAGAATGAGGGLLAWLNPANWGQSTGRTVGVSTTVVAAAAIAAAVMLVASNTPESPPAAAPPPPLEQQPPAPVATESPEEEPPPDDSTAETSQDVVVAAPPGDPEPPPDTAEAPGFDAHPQDVTVRAGEPATLSAVVTGTPTPDLQWQMRNGQAGEWEDVAGEDGSDLELANSTPAFNGRAYRVVATNESGSMISDVAVVTVHYEPVVVAQPHDVDADVGDEVVLRAAAEAGPAVDSVRWQVRSEGGWSDVSGSETSGSTAELVFEDVGFDDAATYRAIFANEIGSVVTSSSAVSVAAVGTLQVEVPRIGGQNESVVRCVEPSGERVRLSECATATWQLSPDGALRWSDGTCLDVRDVGGVLHHATTASCTGSDSQQWTIDPADAGPQRLQNRDGVCLTAHGWHRASILAAHPCDLLSDRQFVFAPDN